MWYFAVAREGSESEPKLPLVLSASELVASVSVFFCPSCRSMRGETSVRSAGL